MSTQTLRAPGGVRQERSEWWAVVAGFVALLVTFAILVGVSTLNGSSSGGTQQAPKGGTAPASVVRVGGDGPYQYHPLP